MVSTRSSPRLAPKPVLPLDVCGIIIDILASNKLDPGLISVKKCSLVSQSFLPLCRKHIFATIKIDDPLGTLEPSYSDSDEGPHHVLEEFMQLIKHTPAIGNYIRHLELCFEEDDELDDFPRTMQCLTRLESLAISQFKSLKWRNLKWPVRNALLRLMHLPTLIALTLCFIDGFLVTDLVHGVNLQRLKLKSTTFFEDSADEPPTAMILPAKLVQLQELSVQSSTGGMEWIANARRSDGLPVIDPTQLTTVSVTCNCVDDIVALRTFLKQSEQLIKFDLTGETSFTLLESFFNHIISVHSNLTFVGLGDMITPHIRALKIVDLSTSVNNNRIDPLGGLPGELAKMAGENVLERLSITVDFRERNDKSGAEWGMLDTVLTSSGWPALKAVFLTIRLYKRNGSDALIGPFRKLKKAQFPRLSASKSVDFRFRLTCL